MKAMVLLEHCMIEVERTPGRKHELPYKKDPLAMRDMPAPVPLAGQILVRVSACGICHTEMDEIEGRSSPSPRWTMRNMSGTRRRSRVSPT